MGTVSREIYQNLFYLRRLKNKTIRKGKRINQKISFGVTELSAMYANDQVRRRKTGLKGNGVAFGQLGAHSQKIPYSSRLIYSSSHSGFEGG